MRRLSAGLILALAAAPLALSDGAAARQAAARADEADAQALLAQIAAAGAKAVMARVYVEEGRWSRIIEGVESGTPAWLEVAQKLKPAAGLSGQELTAAVAEALGRNPRNVLAILNVVFDADDVCSLNTLEDSLGEEYGAALRAVERRENAVLSVTDPSLVGRQRECLAFLRELKREVVRNRAVWFVR